MQLKCKKKKKEKKNFVQYREKVLWLIKCVKSGSWFCAGDFSQVDAPWSCWPSEVDSGQIETLIENNQCYTIQDIANILKISKSCDENCLHQLGYINRFDV